MSITRQSLRWTVTVVVATTAMRLMGSAPPGRTTQYIIDDDLTAVIAHSARGGGQLLGTQIAGANELILIAQTTADWTLIGLTGVPGAMNGLAYDSINRTLYGINPARDQLFTINAETGAATPVGSPGDLGFPNANGLAFDPNHQILYATDNNNSLFTIDPTTGTGSFVARITGFTEIEGLAYDAFSDTLFGVTDLQNRIMTINVTTGAATTAVGLPNHKWRGLTFDTVERVLYATSVRQSFLYRVDPSVGLVLVGQLEGASSVQGLGFIPPLPPCPWDLNGDGTVNVPDLLALLAAWGTNPGGPPDFDGDGAVGVPDLLLLLGAWGPCQ